ncbi:hypothetical protein MNBD_GAMMA07-1101 [hydrothermal vent metagenome]|uniref:Cytochrome P460 domain-containing protein n=1 Tax=hydrothermal vent metagenome TaxID=652676 RepID=A0A3B0WNY1_9ZZZZ
MLLSACQSSVTAPPLNNSDDILYAQKLWNVMQKNHLVGEQAMLLQPFFGGAKPHGMILEVYSHLLTVANHKGFLVLKRNYNGDGVSVENVSKNRAKYLSSITIMYQREAGYDEDNLNLFWVKYKPDGKLFVKELKGHKLSLAGRLIKGNNDKSNKACLYCHASAGGGDYIFYPDIKLPGFHYIGH